MNKKYTAKKQVLGRGLGNLLSLDEEVAKPKENSGFLNIASKNIVVNPNNPRKKFDTTAITELSQTIKQHGLISPIVVRLCKDNRSYEVISGERRLRACRLLGMEKIPCIIKEYSEQTSIEVALIENIQREDLDPIEEAHVYKQLVNKYHLTQQQLADRVGKNRSTIANRMRLLDLPLELQAALSDSRLTEGQVRPLLGIQNKIIFHKLSKQILLEKPSARQVEKLVEAYRSKENKPSTSYQTNSALSNIKFSRSFANQLQEQLGTKVQIKHSEGKKKGTILIHYYSIDDFERLWKKLCN